MAVYNFDLVGSGATYKKNGGNSMSIKPGAMDYMNLIDAGTKIDFKIGVIHGVILSTDTIVVNGVTATGSMATKRNLILSNVFFFMQVIVGGGGDGTGDMLKSIYDTNNNGKVNMAEDAEALGGELPVAYVLKSEPKIIDGGYI